MYSVIILIDVNVYLIIVNTCLFKGIDTLGKTLLLCCTIVSENAGMHRKSRYDLHGFHILFFPTMIKESLSAFNE